MKWAYHAVCSHLYIEGRYGQDRAWSTNTNILLEAYEQLRAACGIPCDLRMAYNPHLPSKSKGARRGNALWPTRLAQICMELELDFSAKPHSPKYALQHV